MRYFTYQNCILNLVCFWQVTKFAFFLIHYKVTKNPMSRFVPLQRLTLCTSRPVNRCNLITLLKERPWQVCVVKSKDIPCSLMRGGTRDNHNMSSCKAAHFSYIALSPTNKKDGASLSALEKSFMRSAACCNTTLSEAFPLWAAIHRGKLAAPVVVKFVSFRHLSVT